MEPGTRVLVVGLGVSGLAAARELVALNAKVRVTEAGDSELLRARAAELRGLGVEVELGGHDPAALEADVAVVSPGIPPAAPVMVALREHGVEIWSEVELAARLARCAFLAVTGTNGKTTTTSLLAAMLREAGIPSVAAGNIGLPLVEAVADVPEEGAVAVEVSSFQLAAIHTFHPKVAVLLNVAEDHTDWHGSVEGYARAKARITENQTSGDVFLFNAEDGWARRIAASSAATTIPFSIVDAPADGIGVDGVTITWRGDALMAAADVPLPGAAGLEDVVAAAGAALGFGVDPRAVVRAVKSFRPLAHRLETVAELDRVTYINDSKATNPHATIAAVVGLEDVVLIAGGRSKGIDLSPLAGIVPPVRAVIAMGEATTELEQVFSGVVPVERAGDMRDAVERARSRSVAGGSVLLSPACASLDMYGSYVARGEAFVRAVHDIVKKNQEDVP